MINVKVTTYITNTLYTLDNIVTIQRVKAKLPPLTEILAKWQKCWILHIIKGSSKFLYFYEILNFFINIYYKT